MAESYPDLVELISRLKGKDRKTCELALHCLLASDRRDKRLRDKTELVVAENIKLRAALKPFADAAEHIGAGWSDDDSVGIGCSVGDLRAAAAALKETGDE